MISEINLMQMFPGSTRDARGLDRVLGALERHPALTPTHASVDERKRLPYDKAASIEKVVSDAVLALQLWRGKAPRYTGGLSTRDESHNLFRADYPDPSDAARAREVFHAATELADTLAPAFGFVHSKWRLGEASQRYNEGVGITRMDLWRYGLAQVHARTWFGPDLVTLIGEAHLLALPESTRTAWGGVQLDLAPEPWTADFSTLQRRQSEVRAALAPLHLFYDTELSSARRVPAAGWKPPAWNIR